eukprot:TRINITY_DN5098_c0_g1_i1.p1 TRINITY_DN5098_c0_g1~~TRINITY_DN5098_c0_g1_i1.p1  ORF type:complete len:319 (-),score=14.88 TRINITY_DN5098_c0_g1_i1:80-1036(-)
MLHVSLRIIKLIYVIVAPISLVCSAFIVVTFFAFRNKLFNQRTGVEFIFYQSVCDFVFSLKLILTGAISDPSWFISYPGEKVEDTPWCVALGFIDEIASSSSVSWNTMVSLRILMTVWDPFHWEEKPPPSWVFHIPVWGWTIPATIVIASLGQIGPTIDGCWIKDEFTTTRMILAIPFFLCLCASSIIMFVVLYKNSWNRIITNIRVPRSDAQKRFEKLMISYTVVFLVCWSPSVLVRVLEYAQVEAPALVYLDHTCISAQGFGNAIVWCLFSNTFRNLFRKKPEQKPLIASQDRSSSLDKDIPYYVTTIQQEDNNKL